jgi:hypothetical protein
MKTIHKYEGCRSLCAIERELGFVESTMNITLKYAVHVKSV